MVFGVLDDLGRAVERSGASLSEAFLEPVIRLGVTGLSRAGKTVFITSLVANLLDRGRMQGLSAGGRIQSVLLRPQPDDLIPRFAFEPHLDAMTGDDPSWPNSTRAISQLRLSFKVAPTGLLGGLRAPQAIHLDIVDYPGEWLLDLPLLEQDFATWSAAGLALARGAARASVADGWLAQLEGADPTADLDEPTAKRMADTFTDYLRAARQAGFSACAPGRFLMPGDLEGSPALTFAPLPKGAKAGRKSLYREFERRFEAYKSRIVKPFFRDHFARLDRQVVLVDALSALHDGPAALHDLRDALADVLGCFRVGNNGWLSALTGRKIDKLAFVATKADHLHHSQHGQLTGLIEALLGDAKRKASYAGAEARAFSVAALRATTETEVTHEGETLKAVQGRLLESGKQVAMYPGALPDDPAKLLNGAGTGDASWLGGDYQVMRFQPAPNTLKAGSGPPHIRMDQVVEFLIGDRL